MKSKKGNTAVIGLAIVIIILVVWWVSIASRDCNTNTDCEDGFYCGSDFACHEIPVIEKAIKSYDLTIASLILAIGLIVAATIYRKKNIP
tara:strand:+ start:955 stop:1224 length:270 start_codon:yes stop_codon:yes gene_type:complete